MAMFKRRELIFPWDVRTNRANQFVIYTNQPFEFMLQLRDTNESASKKAGKPMEIASPGCLGPFGGGMYGNKKFDVSADERFETELGVSLTSLMSSGVVDVFYAGRTYEPTLDRGQFLSLDECHNYGVEVYNKEKFDELIELKEGAGMPWYTPDEIGKMATENAIPRGHSGPIITPTWKKLLIAFYMKVGE